MFGVFISSHAQDERRFRLIGPNNYAVSVTRCELEELWEDILAILRDDDDRGN